LFKVCIDVYIIYIILWQETEQYKNKIGVK